MIALIEFELPWVFLGAIFGLLSTGANFLTPLYIGFAIERLPRAESLTEFSDLFIIVSALTLAEFVFSFLQGAILNLVGYSVSRNLRERLFRSIMIKVISSVRKLH